MALLAAVFSGICVLALAVVILMVGEVIDILHGADREREDLKAKLAAYRRRRP